MPTTSEIRVSIDVGCHSHSVAIGLSTGEVLEEFDLQHRPESFDLFFARVERCQPCVSTYHWTASVRDNIDLRARLRPGRCPSPHTQR